MTRMIGKRSTPAPLGPSRSGYSILLRRSVRRQTDSGSDGVPGRGPARITLSEQWQAGAGGSGRFVQLRKVEERRFKPEQPRAKA
jgi:hypothetical protein